MQKRIVIILISLLLIFILSIIAWYIVKNNRVDLITYRDPHLTQEEIKPFLERIAEAEHKLSDPKNGTNAERYILMRSIANEYYSIGELAKSRDYFIQATELFPKEAVSWFQLANVETYMKDNRAAQEHYDKALSIEPTNPEYWRGKIDFLKNNLGYSNEQIEGEIGKAMEQTKDHVDIISYHAKYLESIGDLPGAVALWKKAIERNPSGAEIYEQEIKNIQQKVQ